MDIVEAAIRKFSPLLRAVGGNESYQGSLRARLRALPQLLLENGLTSTILFYAAKAEVENLKKALMVYEGRPLTGMTKEQAGYALALSAILKFLQDDLGLPLPSGERFSAESFLEFLNGELAPRRREVMLRLLPFTVELKRLAEASLKEAGGE